MKKFKKWSDLTYYLINRVFTMDVADDFEYSNVHSYILQGLGGRVIFLNYNENDGKIRISFPDQQVIIENHNFDKVLEVINKWRTK